MKLLILFMLLLPLNVFTLISYLLYCQRRGLPSRFWIQMACTCTRDFQGRMQVLGKIHKTIASACMHCTLFVHMFIYMSCNQEEQNRRFIILNRKHICICRSVATEIYKLDVSIRPNIVAAKCIFYTQ